MKQQPRKKPNSTNAGMFTLAQFGALLRAAVDGLDGPRRRRRSPNRVPVQTWRKVRGPRWTRSAAKHRASMRRKAARRARRKRSKAA